jgi:hypothetical protein
MARTSLKGAVIALAFSSYAHTALADGGCSGCFENSGCAWVCAITFSVVAVPLWLFGAVLCLLLVPRLRSARPQLLALPFAYIGSSLAVQLIEASPSLAVLVAAVPTLAWYLACARMPLFVSLRR